VNVVLGGFALREVALGGITGPVSRGRAAVRGAGHGRDHRRARSSRTPAGAHSLRAAEHQLRERRINPYRAAMRTVGANN
jgi:hypothetical protein